MRALVLLCAGGLALMATACGEPPSRGESFNFDPEPAVTLEDGTAVLAEATPSCGSVLADEVGALIANDHYDEFRRWLDDYPFEVFDESPGGMATWLGFEFHLVLPRRQSMSFVGKRE
jgi:hypothetical protein